MRKILALCLFCAAAFGADASTVALTEDESRSLELHALREAVLAKEAALLRVRLAEVEREREKAGAEALRVFRELCETKGMDPDKTVIGADFKTLRRGQ